MRLNSRKCLMMGADIVIVLAVFAVISLLFDYTLNLRQIGILTFVIVLQETLFVVVGIYTILWRYAEVLDYFRLGCICLFSGVVFFICDVYLAEPRYGRIACIFFMLLNANAIIFVRVLYRYLQYKVRKGNKTKCENQPAVAKRLLIIGAGTASIHVFKETRTIQTGYVPVCFVDDDPNKISRRINEVPIEGPSDRIPQICKKYRVDVILFAIPSCGEERRKEILSICSTTGCEVKTLPFIHEIVFHSGAGLFEQARKVNIEDLLGRAAVIFDDQSVQAFIQNKVCLVTGGGGSIGSELCRQIAKYNPRKLVLVDIYENNAYDIQQELNLRYGNRLQLCIEIASVRDRSKMECLFQKYRPEIVFHAAAHKHVPLMETNPEEAVKNNVVGTYIAASLANEYAAQKFVLISTDKAVNPTNVMGATKRCCEMIVQYMAQQRTQTEFVAVRFGNVLGSNGSVIPLFKREIENGGPVTVTHPDVIRYFMTIPEAVSLILQAGNMAKGGEIFVLNMGEPVHILTLAENLIRLSGFELYKDIEIQFTGLRPGEKLYEELLMNEEGLKQTNHKRIFIGKQIEIEEDEFLSKLRGLKEAADHNDKGKILDWLKILVPTFDHNRDLNTSQMLNWREEHES